MSLKTGNESVSNEEKTAIFQGDDFTIENGIIKGKEIPIPCNFNHLGELIWHCLNETPEHVAQIDAATGNKKSFRDLKERSIRLALWLTKTGVKPGDIITLCSSDYIDIDVIICATFLVGAIYNVFPLQIDLKTVRRFLKHIEPRVLFVHIDKVDTIKEAAELEKHACEIVVIDDDGMNTSFADILSVCSPDEVENFEITKDVNPESLCLIMPTSGTTGTPKFVSFSHEKLLRLLPLKSTTSQTSNIGELVLLCLSPEWIVHCVCWLRSLILKITPLFVKDFDPIETSQVIEKYKVKILILNAYKVLLYCDMDASAKYDLNSVLVIISMGLELPAKVIDKIDKIFPNAFHQRTLGSTEASAITRYTPKCCNLESQGTIAPNVQVKIIDAESGKTLGPNESGEICVKSPEIMTNYYKNPTETALMYDDEGWFHTGDEAYYDENGEIVFVGRLKDIIRYQETDIQAAQVEQILMSHPNILEAAVVGIPHELYAEQPVTCIKKVQGSNITDEDVLKLTRELRYNDALKNWIVYVEEIPRTTNGKINKKILKKQLEKLIS